MARVILVDPDDQAFGRFKAQLAAEPLLEVVTINRTGLIGAAKADDRAVLVITTKPNASDVLHRLEDARMRGVANPILVVSNGRSDATQRIGFLKKGADDCVDLVSDTREVVLRIGALSRRLPRGQ